MRDNRCIIQQISNVVDDRYRINVFTSAWFKVFSPHLTYISELKSLKLSKILLLFTVHCLLFTLSGCGYTIQTKANLPFDTISVGNIENKTLEPKLQDRFNRQLAETFAEYGFSVRSSARYRLEGEITRFELTPLVEQNLVATQYEVVIKANFRLMDTAIGRSVPLVAGSPFITYFSSADKLENVLAQKELSTNSALKNLSQEVVRIITYNTPKNFAYLLFAVSDIKDLNGLVLRLKDVENPVAVYLRGQFSQNTRQMLIDYDGSKAASDKLKTALVDELNAVMQGASIFDEKRFAAVVLRDETLKLVKQNPGGIERIRLNRLLLEDACPDKISRLQKIPERQK
ncbi:MAG: LptE family protein [Nitrospiraceae bacterium]|nr:LptE family protein [Nitrospiraceae bacterium]